MSDRPQVTNRDLCHSTTATVQGRGQGSLDVYATGAFTTGTPDEVVNSGVTTQDRDRGGLAWRGNALSWRIAQRLSR